MQYSKNNKYLKKRGRAVGGSSGQLSIPTRIRRSTLEASRSMSYRLLGRPKVEHACASANRILPCIHPLSCIAIKTTGFFAWPFGLQIDWGHVSPHGSGRTIAVTMLSTATSKTVDVVCGDFLEKVSRAIPSSMSRVCSYRAIPGSSTLSL